MGDAPPVSRLLDQAANLLRVAIRQSERDQTELGRHVEYYPHTHHGELAAEWILRARHDVVYLSGAVTGRQLTNDGLFGVRLTELAQRIGSMRLVYHPSVLTDPVRRAFACRIRDHRVGVRVSAAHEYGFGIFDRLCALVWESEPDLTQHCLLIRSRAIVKPLLKIADTTWEWAQDVETFRAFGDHESCGLAMRVIGMLGAGLKDDVAARQLGVSVRTYRRYVAGVLRKLGAESRFEAGVRAATLGLVDRPPPKC